MKAAVFTAPRSVEMREVPTPVPGCGEVLVRVKACGICGSELPFYDGVPDAYCSFPWTIGHEISGVVEEINGDGNGLKKGDRVVMEITLNCGECYACRIGKYNCCANMKLISCHTSGGFAEYVAAPAERCFKIPDDMPFDLAAMCEPYSIGAQCIKRAAVTSGDKVVIHGAGAIGLAIMEFARLQGASVLITDVHESRLRRAKAFGADGTVNARSEDVNSRIMRFTGNEGASVVMDASGVPSVISGMADQTASGGRILMVGITQDKVSFSGLAIIKKELTILGSRNSTGVFPDVVRAVYGGRLHAKEMITDRFKFEDTGKAFEYALANFSEIGKVMVVFDE